MSLGGVDAGGAAIFPGVVNLLGFEPGDGNPRLKTVSDIQFL